MPQVEEPSGISSFFRNLFTSEQNSSQAHEAFEGIQPTVDIPRHTDPPSIGAIKPSGFVKKDDYIYIK